MTLRTRILHERRLPGCAIRLEDDPIKQDGYVLRIVTEKTFTEFYDAMNGFRAAVDTMVNDNVCRNDT